jgi:hypothetical protein
MDNNELAIDVIGGVITEAELDTSRAGITGRMDADARNQLDGKSPLEYKPPTCRPRAETLGSQLVCHMARLVMNEGS